MSSLKKLIGAASVTFALLLGVTNLSAEELTWTKGVVKKVDTVQNKVTVKHQEIKNLDMPSMTMIFFVPDPSVLGKMKEGEAKEFAFGDQFGRMIVEDVK